MGNTQQRKVNQIPSLWFSNVLLCCVVFLCVCSTTGHYYYFSKKWNWRAIFTKLIWHWNHFQTSLLHDVSMSRKVLQENYNLWQKIPGSSLGLYLWLRVLILQMQLGRPMTHPSTLKLSVISLSTKIRSIQLLLCGKLNVISTSQVLTIGALLYITYKNTTNFSFDPAWPSKKLCSLALLLWTICRKSFTWAYLGRFLGFFER